VRQLLADVEPAREIDRGEKRLCAWLPVERQREEGGKVALEVRVSRKQLVEVAVVSLLSRRPAR
jgi:hypothetical protein